MCHSRCSLISPEKLCVDCRVIWENNGQCIETKDSVMSGHVKKGTFVVMKGNPVKVLDFSRTRKGTCCCFREQIRDLDMSSRINTLKPIDS